jgi:response regulator NasT
MVLAYLAKPFSPKELADAIERSGQRLAEFRALLGDAADPQLAVKNRELLRLAKGVLMKRSSLTDREAFLHLRRLADENQVALTEMAQRVVDAERSPNASPDLFRRAPHLPNCV